MQSVRLQYESYIRRSDFCNYEFSDLIWLTSAAEAKILMVITAFWLAWVEVWLGAVN